MSGLREFLTGKHEGMNTRRTKPTPVVHVFMGSCFLVEKL
jgi:hypothetical protein